MQDAALMRHLERPRDLHRQAHGVGDRHRALKRTAIEVLEHQIVRPDIVNLADMRMVERGNCTRFLFESRNVRRAHALDGDDAIEPRVASFPDLAHAAAAERLEDLIRP
jgi:hypothetical protein